MIQKYEHLVPELRRSSLRVSQQYPVKGWWFQPRIGATRGGQLADIYCDNVTTVSTPVSVRSWGLHLCPTISLALMEAPAYPCGRLWQVDGWGDADVECGHDARGVVNLYACEHRRYLACLAYRDCLQRWVLYTFMQRLRTHPDFERHQYHPDVQQMLAWPGIYEPDSFEFTRFRMRLLSLTRRAPCLDLIASIGCPFTQHVEDAAINMLSQKGYDACITDLDKVMESELYRQDQTPYRTLGYLTAAEVIQYQRVHGPGCSMPDIKNTPSRKD